MRVGGVSRAVKQFVVFTFTFLALAWVVKPYAEEWYFAQEEIRYILTENYQTYREVQRLKAELRKRDKELTDVNKLRLDEKAEHVEWIKKHSAELEELEWYRNQAGGSETTSLATTAQKSMAVINFGEADDEDEEECDCDPAGDVETYRRSAAECQERLNRLTTQCGKKPNKITGSGAVALSQ